MNKKRIIKLLLLITWLILIFYFSNQNGLASNKKSDSIVNVTQKVINIDTHTLVVIVRKSAHIFEYLVLFILMYLNISEYKKEKSLIMSLLITIICSIIDEIHQLFIYERSGNVNDIFIDSIGIFLGYIIIKSYQKKKIKH